MKQKIPLVELKYLLKNSCSQETSDAPDKWTPENPLFGHCAVIAAIFQDFYGGWIKRALFPKELADKFGSRSHYWNEEIIFNSDLPENFDLSRDQFPSDFPYDDFVNGEVGEMSENKDWRDYILSFDKTANRHVLLASRVLNLLMSNPLFTDLKFQHAWELAFSGFSGESKCLKMRFVCSVYDKVGNLITESTNKNFCVEFGKERLCSFDGSVSVRLGMPSRTDATLGDCGHAPIWCLAKVFELGWKPSDLPMLDFYEAGFKPDGSPWWRDEPSYTCTYCENMFAVFGLDKIYGTFDGRWQPLWTKDSLYSSTEYAKGTKKA